MRSMAFLNLSWSIIETPESCFCFFLICGLVFVMGLCLGDRCRFIFLGGTGGDSRGVRAGFCFDGLGGEGVLSLRFRRRSDLRGCLVCLGLGVSFSCVFLPWPFYIYTTRVSFVLVFFLASFSFFFLAFSFLASIVFCFVAW